MKPNSRLRTLSQLAPWWLFAPAALALALATMPFSDLRIVYSTSWSMATGLVLSVVYWPITVAVAAAVMVRSQRTGAQQMVQNLGSAASVKDFAARWLVIGVGAVSGMVTAFVVGGVLGLIHRSPLTAARLPDLLAVCVMTFALVGVGLVIGLVAPWRLTPVIVAPALYLAFAFDILGAPSLLVFGDVTSDLLTFAVTKPSAVAWFLGLAVGIGGLALAAAWWFAARSRLAIATTFVMAIVTVGFWQVTNSADFQNGVYHPIEASSWICREVGSHGSQVCLPPDQRRDLDLVTDQANRIDQRLNQLVTEPLARDYSPFSTGEVSLSRLPLLMPLGDNSTEAFAETASDVAYTLISACWEDDFNPTTDLSDDEVLEAAYVVGQWLNPGSMEAPPYAQGRVPPPMHPTQEEASQAYQQIETCWQ